MTTTTKLSALLATLTLAACAGEITGGGDDHSTDAGVDPPSCDVTRSYPGFGGAKLEADRPALAAGTDRLRLKPFTALATEYAAALGLTTFDTSAFATTFGKPPARWFSEPAASANTIYAAFALAYGACTQHTATDALYAAAPTSSTADQLCRSFASRAWHRDANAAEVAACTSYALDKTNPTSAPRARWAYTCAAVLSASGFLTY